MASALVGRIRAREKRAPGTVGFVVTVYFSGADVIPEVEGVPYEIDVAVPEGYSLGTFKSALSTGVQALAGELGLVVVPADIDVPSYEAAGGPPP